MEPFRRFSSEALLQQATAGLLVRMPDITGVQILQGPQEFGKDIVFRIRGGFGESLLCACVVKNARISGDVRRAEGARTVFLQAQQAFDTPHVDEFGQDVYVERVYIVTPYDLSPTTIASIRGQLQERKGQIVFIGGVILFDLFKQYWPDFLADEADAIEKHLRQMSDNLENSNPLIGVAAQFNLGNIDIRSRKIYVSQAIHRDLYSYMKGEILIDTIPKESTLFDKASHNDLQKIIEGLRSLKSAIVFLGKWRYYWPNQNSSNNMEQAIDEFVSAYERAWREGVSRQVGIPSSKAHKIAPDVGVLLNKPGDLVQLLRGLRKKRDSSLLILDTALARLSKIVYTPPQNGSKALSNSLLMSACILDQCAQVASDGIFKVNKHSEGQLAKARLEFPKSLLDEWTGHLLVVGAPGFGKTSFCRWYALQDLERFNSGKANILPVYVPLHRLGRGELASFEQTFLESFGKSALIAEEKQAIADLSDKRIRLYLDGLDEVLSEKRRFEIIDLARRGAQENSQYQILVTARDHVNDVWLNWLPRVALSGLDNDGILTLIERWFGESPEEAKRFREQLRDTPTLAQLMQTPLLATLIILVFRQTRRLPESKTKLYEMFIDLLSGGWDVSKGIIRETRFGQRIKKLVITTLAGKVHQTGQREFSSMQIKNAMKATVAPSLARDWEAMRDELNEDGLISRSGDTLQFPHHSFQEFLTAKDLIGDPHQKGLRRAFVAYLDGDDWWREVLRFYIGLSSKPRELTRWFLAEAERNQNLSRSRLDDVLASVAESFPEFPLDEMSPRRRRP